MIRKTFVSITSRCESFLFWVVFDSSFDLNLGAAGARSLHLVLKLFLSEFEFKERKYKNNCYLYLLEDNFFLFW